MLIVSSCHGAFKCRNIEDGSNGGCAADNLYHVLAVGGVNAAVNDNSPTGRARLPKRDESGDGLLRNSERLTEEGEVSYYTLCYLKMGATFVFKQITC